MGYLQVGALQESSQNLISVRLNEGIGTSRPDNAGDVRSLFLVRPDGHVGNNFGNRPAKDIEVDQLNHRLTSLMI